MKSSCESCGNPIDERVRFCPHCAGERRKKTIGIPAVCPQCHCMLEENKYRGSTIDICPSCSGLWLDIDEYEFHSSPRDTYSDPSVPRKYLRPPIPEKGNYLQCVRCEALMTKINFRRISGVVIDICRDHGVWLEAGELEQIRSFIANGGVDKSQDKDIVANRTEITRLAEETKDLKAFCKEINQRKFNKIFWDGM